MSDKKNFFVVVSHADSNFFKGQKLHFQKMFVFNYVSILVLLVCLLFVGIESNGSLLFPLAANNIYAIRQNYLFRTELFEGTPLFYNRNYGSFHLPLTNLNRFTILFTTGQCPKS